MVRAGVAFVVAVLAISPGAAAEIRATAQLIPIALLDTGGRVLQVSPYEVTVASWRQCFDSGGCTHLPVRPSASGQLPVTGVNWFDVNEYLAWTNSKDGGEVRLPSLSEWREIARSIAHEKPARLFTDPRLAWAATYGQEIMQTGPPRGVGSFSTTSEGISDLDGNVWEWTSSCAKPGFGDLCPAYVVAGEHEAVISVFVRDPGSGGCATGTPPTYLGFRLVSDSQKQ